MKTVGTILILSLLIGAAVTAQEDTGGKYFKSSDEYSSYFDLGIGVMFGSSFKDDLEDRMGYVISGGGGWAVVNGGLRFGVSRQFYIGPSLAMNFTTLKFENCFSEEYGDAFSSSKATILLIPSFDVSFLAVSSISKRFEISAGFGYPYPVTDLDEPELESGGVSWSLGASFVFGGGFRVGLGYAYYPIKASGGDFVYLGPDDPFVMAEETSNYGGFAIFLGRQFYID